MFDLVVRSAEVFDGSGGPARSVDVGVCRGVIQAVERLPVDVASRVVVEGDGLALAPGFIDIHAHSDYALLSDPFHLPKLSQGVTTDVFSNCGLGFAPLPPDRLEEQHAAIGALFGDRPSLLQWSGGTFAAYAAALEAAQPAVNIALLAPHGAVRATVVGSEARPATRPEIAAMAALVRLSREEGAWGASTGTWYSSMSSARDDELDAIARAARFLAVHQRDYGAGLMGATAETIALARRTGVRVQLSHLQTSGACNEGRGPEIVAVLDRARRAGADLAWDSYPYCAGSTLLSALLPDWALSGTPSVVLRRLRDSSALARIVPFLECCGRDWSRHVMVGLSSSAMRRFDGLSFVEGAEGHGSTVEGFICSVLVAEELRACYIVHHMVESDLETILAHPAQVVGSDGLHMAPRGHPRLWGAFARVLGRYVRERRVLSLPDAIRKMSSAPAEAVGLRDRGRIAPGMAADLVLFDAERVSDRASYTEHDLPAEGILRVWVNGMCAIHDGRSTGTRAGRLLRSC